MSWMQMKRYRLTVSKFPLGKQQVSCQIETEKECSLGFLPSFSLLLQAVASSLQMCGVLEMELTQQPQKDEGSDRARCQDQGLRAWFPSFAPPGCVCPVRREACPVQESSGFSHSQVFSCHPRCLPCLVHLRNPVSSPKTTPDHLPYVLGSLA